MLSVVVQVLEDSKAMKKEKWVKDNQGQLIITAGQMVWTAECERALSDVDEGTRKALRHLKKKWISYLNKLTTITRSKLSKIERNKVLILHFKKQRRCSHLYQKWAPLMNSNFTRASYIHDADPWLLNS